MGTQQASAHSTNPAPLPPNPDLEKLIDQIDGLLTFLAATVVPDGMNSCSPIRQGFGLAIRRLGKKIYRLGGHDALLIAAQLIVLRHPRDRNQRMDVLNRRWCGIGGDQP